MRLRFLCPSTGHKIEIALEADDEKLLLIRKEDLQTPCSFCGGSRKWVFVQLCAARSGNPARNTVDFSQSLCHFRSEYTRADFGKERVNGFKIIAMSKTPFAGSPLSFALFKCSPQLPDLSLKPSVAVV
jgi:hypothetical protein